MEKLIKDQRAQVKQLEDQYAREIVNNEKNKKNPILRFSSDYVVI